MTSENETMMAVCAEWRECIEAADPTVWDDARIAGLVKTTKAQQLAYLDRIEAAAKREEAEWESAACACVSDAVMSGRVAVEHPPIGNAAAMREALIEMRDHADKKIGVTCNVSLLAEYGWFVQKINAALSAPLAPVLMAWLFWGESDEDGEDGQ